MKAVLRYLKVIFLTIITFGIYGAYWIVKNMQADEDDPGMSEEEKKARRAQNNMYVTGLQYFRRR